MKTSKYNKSDIMKSAHSIRKEHGFSMSDALTMAWTKAKKGNKKPNILLATLERNGLLEQANQQAEREIKKDNEIKEFQRKNTRISNMNHLSNTLTNSYNRGSGAYYGD